MEDFNECTITGEVAVVPHLSGSEEDPNSRVWFKVKTSANGRDNYIPVVVEGTEAKLCAEKLKKGSKVSIKGHINTRSKKIGDVWTNNFELMSHSVSFSDSIKPSERTNVEPSKIEQEASELHKVMKEIAAHGLDLEQAITQAVALENVKSSMQLESAKVENENEPDWNLPPMPQAPEY